MGRDLDRALGLAEGVVEQVGEVPELLDTLATVRLRRGETKQALELIERALAEAEGETRAHLLDLRSEALALPREVEGGEDAGQPGEESR
jgi:hypothetical protein